MGEDARSTVTRATVTRAGPAVWTSIIQAVLAVLLFSVSDALAKLLRVSLPAVEVAWLRYVTFTGFAILLAGRGRFAALWPSTSAQWF